MEKNHFILSEMELRDAATKYFLSACGLDLSKEKHQRMFKAAMAVRARIMDGLDVSGKTYFMDAAHYVDGRIVVDDMSLECDVFDWIPKDAVTEICFYLLTMGEGIYPVEKDFLKLVYADIWYTCYLEASAALLKKKIKMYLKGKGRWKASSTQLSNPFGPGYFGIPTITSKDFVRILEGEQLGVSTIESGQMLPQKTCTGVYFLLNRKIQLAPKCMECQGNSQGCRYCMENA